MESGALNLRHLCPWGVRVGNRDLFAAEITEGRHHDGPRGVSAGQVRDSPPDGQAITTFIRVTGKIDSRLNVLRKKWPRIGF